MQLTLAVFFYFTHNWFIYNPSTYNLKHTNFQVYLSRWQLSEWQTKWERPCSWRNKQWSVHSCASVISISVSQLLDWEACLNSSLCCWNRWLVPLAVYLKMTSQRGKQIQKTKEHRRSVCVYLCFRVPFRVPRGAWCKRWNSRWESWGSTLTRAAVMELKETQATAGPVLVLPQF